MRQRVTLTLKKDTTPGVGGEQGFLVSSFAHIPGAVLRGGLAARWIAEYGPPTQDNANRGDFIEIFHGDIRFGPAFADGTAAEPMSAKVCKYKPNPECKTEAVDLAFEDDKYSCGACKGPLELGKGRILNVTLRDRTRTAIDFESQTAKDGHLFRREVIPAGTSLRGFIRGTDPWLESVSGSSIWLGGKRTVAGKSLFELVKEEPVSVPSGSVLVIRFTSPAILVDRAALPITNVTEAAVAFVLGVDPSTISSVCGWTRMTWVGGWHIASGLPKPQDVALAAGSTLRIELASSIPEATLKRLFQRGLGVRTEEGYGSFEFVTQAWRPPTVGGTTGSMPAPERWTRLRGMSFAERKWAGNLLRDRWSDLSNGKSLTDISHRRLRAWSQEETEELRELAALDNAKEQSRIITLLLHEGDDAK